MMRIKLIFAVALLISWPATAEELTFFPTHDAYTQNGNNHNNHELRVENTNRVRITYLQFDLSDLKGPPEKAKLLLTGGSDKSSGDMTIRLFAAESSDWDEFEINGETAPEKGGEIALFEGNIEIGQVVEFNVTSLIKEPGTYTIIIENDESPLDVSFVSKDGNFEEEFPQLLITEGAPTNELEITSVERDNESGDVSIQWNSIPGRNYGIYVTDSLDSDWIEIDDNFEATEENSTFVDSDTGGATTRYYYIREFSG